MPSSFPGIPMARGKQGWSTFTDRPLSPKTCRVWVSSSLDRRDVGMDPAQRCGITVHHPSTATHIPIQGRCRSPPRVWSL